jgi:hypothetical protein
MLWILARVKALFWHVWCDIAHVRALMTPAVCLGWNVKRCDRLLGQLHALLSQLLVDIVSDSLVDVEVELSLPLAEVESHIDEVDLTLADGVFASGLVALEVDNTDICIKND